MFGLITYIHSLLCFADGTYESVMGKKDGMDLAYLVDIDLVRSRVSGS